LPEGCGLAAGGRFTGAGGFAGLLTGAFDGGSNRRLGASLGVFCGCVLMGGRSACGGVAGLLGGSLFLAGGWLLIDGRSLEGWPGFGRCSGGGGR